MHKHALALCLRDIREARVSQSSIEQLESKKSSIYDVTHFLPFYFDDFQAFLYQGLNIVVTKVLTKFLSRLRRPSWTTRNYLKYSNIESVLQIWTS